MPAEDLVELEIMLNRFNRLMGEVMEGRCRRNSFLPWELAILVDMENCQLERRRRLEIGGAAIVSRLHDLTDSPRMRVVVGQFHAPGEPEGALNRSVAAEHRRGRSIFDVAATADLQLGRWRCRLYTRPSDSCRGESSVR